MPDPLSLTAPPAGTGERQGALVVALLSALVLAIMAPVAGQPWPALPAFIPAYQTAAAVCELVTAALLFGQFRDARQPTLLLLAGGYLHTAIIVIAHMLSFPDAFGPAGFIGGPQTTVWLWLAWHVPFPLVVMAYAWPAGIWRGARVQGAAVAGVAVLLPLGLAGAAVLMAVAGHGHLPALLDGNHYIPGVTRPVVALPLLLSLLALAMLAVRTRLRRSLDLWLAVTMGAWSVEILLGAVLNSGRFQAGFYVGRLYGLLASGGVLTSLLLATAVLHGRLARGLAGERDTARAELRASEDRYQLTVESARDYAIVTLDRDGTITGWNIGAERMMGYVEAEAVGRSAAIFFTPEDVAAEADKAEITRAREQGRAEDERWHRRRDGSQFWGSGLMMPLAGSPGGGYVKIFQDKTQAHEAKAALERSVEDFRTLADNMSQLAWMTEPDGWIFWYNQRWFDYTGTTFDEMQGWGWGNVHHPDHIERVVARFKAALEVGQPWEDTFPLRGADGQYRWFLSRALPIRDPAGRIVRWLGTNTDVTVQRETEGALAAREAELRRLNEDLELRVRDAVSTREAALSRLAHAQRLEALGQLAGGIAHDFNNIMQAVQSGAGLIRRRAANPQTVDYLARMVEDAAVRGASVTRRLLAFARKGELQAEAVDPSYLLRSIQEVLEHTLSTGIQVRIEEAAGSPLLADKGQLETVLVNLAANARDAMPNGGTLILAAAEELVTEAGAEDRPAHEAALAPGCYVRLTVSDTGEGMTAEVLARASEPFFTTKEQGKGTGLGLAMARGFAEQSGGGFAIRSIPGMGTRVTLWLPAAQGTEPARATDMGGREAPRPADRVQVLVVDDEDLVREVLAESLEGHGYATQRAGNAAAALAMLDAGAEVDVLLTDYAMPVVDGLTLIGEARRRRPRLVAVLLTGNVSGEVEARLALDGMAGGPFSLVRKPVKAGELAARIDAVLGRVEQTQPQEDTSG